MNKSAALRRIASLEQRLADLEEQLATVEEGHQAHSLFDEYDYNQDGLIDSAEWGGTQELFEALDTDMDGVLTPSEVSVGMGNSFSKLASRRASKHKGLARRVLNKKAHNLFEEYDLNMDGVIDTTEWGGSMDAFDALDTNMDSLLDESEVAMGVGSSFSKLSYGQEEYLTPEEMADIMGGTLISKQASRRRASLGTYRYQALDKIIKAVKGKVLETSEKAPYLKKHINPESALQAAVQVGGLFWEMLLVVDSESISVTATLIGDEFPDGSEQTIYRVFSPHKNGWEFELAQLMTTVARKFMKKNKLPPSYQSGWLNQEHFLVTTENPHTMDVGSSFSKLSYGQEEQASRRRASLGTYRYQALNKIVKAIDGKILETSKKVPYLREHINPESALQAAVQVGGLFWEMLLVVDSESISVTATLIGDEFPDGSEQTINHKFSANKNGWEFELAQLMTAVARKFMKKNKLPPSYRSGWLNQEHFLVTTENPHSKDW